MRGFKLNNCTSRSCGYTQSEVNGRKSLNATTRKGKAKS